MEQLREGAQNVRQGRVYNLTCEDAETDPTVIKDESEHEGHLRIIMQTLKDHKLYICQVLKV